MNANSQPPTTVEIRPANSTKQTSEVPQSLMKNWLHAVSERKGGDASAQSGVDNTGLACGDGGLAGLPEAMQAQLLQERFRQSFDAEGGSSASTELPDSDEEGLSVPNSAANDEMIGRAQTPSMAGRNDAAVDAETARAEQGLTERMDQLNTADEDIDIDDDIDDEDIDETAGDIGRQHAPHTHHEIKVEPPQSFLPRDSTDYRWIEKFTDRVLIEVEARAADRNLSIQLSHDVIPNATLILSRTGGRWQLNANTDDDTAARGIEDAEQALGARFAARGLGDIQVNVARNQLRPHTDAFA